MEQTKKLLLYHGDNPLFKRLTDDLSKEGFTFESIPQGDRRADGFHNGPKQYLEQINNNFDVIFTDNTMFGHGFKNVFSAYNLMKTGGSWLTDIKTICDYFVKKGKTPIINPYGLSHHLSENYNEVLKTLEDAVGKEKVDEYKTKVENIKLPDDNNQHNEKSVYLAYLLGDHINAKVVSYSTPRRYYDKVLGRWNQKFDEENDLLCGLKSTVSSVRSEGST